jgi:hypothetical protein
MGIINKISAKLLVLFTTKKYRLKREIRQTIKVYELACKPENLNYEYCFYNNIHFGICHYTLSTNKLLLNRYINNKLSILVVYITETPSSIQTMIETRLSLGYFDLTEMNERIKNANEFRINFLKNQLKEL